MEQILNNPDVVKAADLIVLCKAHNEYHAVTEEYNHWEKKVHTFLDSTSPVLDYDQLVTDSNAYNEKVSSALIFVNSWKDEVKLNESKQKMADTAEV